METQQLTEQRRIGLELHDAERAIYLGKQAIGEILAQQPVDSLAIEETRLVMHDARMTRNDLRRKLAEAKLAEARWTNRPW